MTDYLVFDLETQYSAQDVGGWEHIDEMKMSVGVVWDSIKQDFFVYQEEQVFDLIEHLKSGPLVVGFNHIGFDYRVLTGYFPNSERSKVFAELEEVNNLDLLLDIKSRLGFRLKLDNLVQSSLGVGKSADGLQALEWFKEGKMDLIREYCKQDVAVTRDLYLYGLEKGMVYYDSGREGIKKLPVDWHTVVVEEDTPPEQLSF